jgi:predicted nucleic acid-binding protein
MVRDEGFELSRVSKSFSNDILLAISCRETGCVLVTENERDFKRIQTFFQFDFAAPWP